MAKAFQILKEQLNPEAAYFSMEDGTGVLVYDAPAPTWEDLAQAIEGF